MQTLTHRLSRNKHPVSNSEMFYRNVLETLNKFDIPYVVGGGYALNYYMGLERSTKDMDIFIRREDFDRIAELFAEEEEGYAMELTWPHWLGKLHFNGMFMDFIFSSGNGIAAVDELWFRHAEPATIVGVPAQISSVEEMIWSKAFIMERERYDGADIVHLIQARGRTMDWPRLLNRFGPHWRVLLSHLILFGFVYPDQRTVVPPKVMDELLERLRVEGMTPSSAAKLCRGTLLSREQYLNDLRQHGMQDARILPFGNLTAAETAIWTQGIEEEKTLRE
jgi:hypothetical protein